MPVESRYGTAKKNCVKAIEHAGDEITHQIFRKLNQTFVTPFDREDIYELCGTMGVIPPETKLTPWPDELPKWETLDADSKKLFARQAEVFAAYVAYSDHEIGRVVQAVEDIGKLDNTLVIYIEGDNGTSSEGSLNGTPNELITLQGIQIPVAAQLPFYDAWARTKRTRIWRWDGRGRSIRPSNGPSRSHPISAAPGKVW